MKKVFIAVLVVILVGVGIYFGYSCRKNNNQSKLQESKKNETKENNNDISMDDLNEINDIAFVNSFFNQLFLFGNSDNEVINNSNGKAEIIFQYAMSHNMLQEKYVDDDPVYQENKDLYDYCNVGSGSCLWLSFDDYKKIAKKYGITNDGSDFYEKTYNNEYYVFGHGGYSFPFYEESHEVTYKKSNDDIVINSNWIYTDRSNSEEKSKFISMSFTFKCNSDKEYYLYSVNSQITNK